MPAGTLFVVATPLGNLQDVSQRALDVLRASKMIACEDTRRTRGLLERFGIRSGRLVSYHKFNERRRCEGILSVLREGGDVALVSDGGTPGLSDPGAQVVEAALDEGLPVSPVPGPSAVAAAVSVCGFTAPSFVFVGFLPARGGQRRRAIEELGGETHPMVIFEAPHRVSRTAADLLDVLGDRNVTLLREMTKMHEEVRRMTLAELAEMVARARNLGEFTLVVQGAAAKSSRRSNATSTKAPTDAMLRRRYDGLLKTGVDRREALKMLTRETGLPRRQIYDRVISRDKD